MLLRVFIGSLFLSLTLAAFEIPLKGGDQGAIQRFAFESCEVLIPLQSEEPPSVILKCQVSQARSSSRNNPIHSPSAPSDSPERTVTELSLNNAPSIIRRSSSQTQHGYMLNGRMHYPSVKSNPANDPSSGGHVHAPAALVRGVDDTRRTSQNDVPNQQVHELFTWINGRGESLVRPAASREGQHANVARRSLLSNDYLRSPEPVLAREPAPSSNSVLNSPGLSMAAESISPISTSIAARANKPSNDAGADNAHVITAATRRVSFADPIVTESPSLSNLSSSPSATKKVPPSTVRRHSFPSGVPDDSRNCNDSSGLRFFGIPKLIGVVSKAGGPPEIRCSDDKNLIVESNDKKLKLSIFKPFHNVDLRSQTVHPYGDKLGAYLSITNQSPNDSAIEIQPPRNGQKITVKFGETVTFKNIPNDSSFNIKVLKGEWYDTYKVDIKLK